jgi:hypothetical protein
MRVAPKAMPTRGPITTPAIQALLFRAGSGAMLVAAGAGVVLVEAVVEVLAVVEDAVGAEVADELVPMDALSTKIFGLEILDTYYWKRPARDR